MCFETDNRPFASPPLVTGSWLPQLWRGINPKTSQAKRHHLHAEGWFSREGCRCEPLTTDSTRSHQNSGQSISTNSKYGIYHILNPHVQGRPFLDSKLWSTDLFCSSPFKSHTAPAVCFEAYRKTHLTFSFSPHLAIISLVFWNNMCCNWNVYSD